LNGGKSSDISPSQTRGAIQQAGEALANASVIAEVISPRFGGRRPSS